MPQACGMPSAKAGEAYAKPAQSPAANRKNRRAAAETFSNWGTIGSESGPVIPDGMPLYSGFDLGRQIPIRRQYMPLFSSASRYWHMHLKAFGGPLGLSEVAYFLDKVPRISSHLPKFSPIALQKTPHCRNRRTEVSVLRSFSGL